VPNYVLKIVIEGEDRASGAIKNVQGALGSLGNIAGGVAIGNLLSDGVKGLAGMAKGALDSYAAYERLGQSINALTAKQALLSGSASTMTQALGQTKQQSKELLGWIEKLAIESPFYQQDVAGAFRMAMALGFNTREAQRLTTAMVDFSVATGQGGETVERISRALGQMRTKGRVSMEEINQLTEAGVDAMRILSDATGLTGEALSKKIAQGAVDADTAVNAILTDTEKLYAGAAKASATSMAGVLSSLNEAKDIIGRELFTGVFEQLQGPLSALTTIVTAPEFKAGLESWSATLGAFTGEQIEAAAGAMERIDKAISPLLNAQAPAWLTALQGAALLTGTEFKVKITPEMTALEQPNDGWKVLVKPYATSIEAPEGGWKVDVSATAISLSTKEGESLSVDAVAKTLTIDPGFSLPALQFKANIDPESQKTIDALLGAGAEGGAKGLGYELGQQTRKELDKELTSLADILKLNFGITFGGKASLDEVVKEQNIGIKTVETTASWKEGTQQSLFDQMQRQFGEPIMLAGSWLADTLGSLWNQVQAQFNANPIDVLAKVKLQLPQIQGPVDSPARQAASRAIGENYGMTTPRQYNGWDDGNAAGTDFWKGGWTWVGEEGPELLNLPRGARILSNPDSMRMIGQNAGGTTQLPPGAGPIVALLGSLGLWKSAGAGAQIGPKTADQARGWQDFTQKGVQAMQTAADRTGAAFEDTAKKVNQTFESALQGVPGLFGTSSVTADDMRKSQLGLYQPKADEYLRQLSDEVLNNKEWGDKVDIKDAAKRAGIDPNLPNDIILELVKEAWNNSSLFAEGKNLDLINTDAVKAAIEQQQKELSGQASLKALFGINDENLQKQSEALGAGLASVFGGASETDAVKGAGTALFAKTMVGFTDPGVAAAGVKGMADSIVTATGTPENQAALYDAGGAGYDTYFNGWKAKANAAPIVPPGGGSGTAPPGGTPPAGNALGTPSWRGGWTVAGEYGPELLNLPGGTSIYDAPTSQRMRRGGMRPMVVNQTFVVNDKLMAEQAAQRAVQLIRKGGR